MTTFFHVTKTKRRGEESHAIKEGRGGGEREKSYYK